MTPHGQEVGRVETSAVQPDAMMNDSPPYVEEGGRVVQSDKGSVASLAESCLCQLRSNSALMTPRTQRVCSLAPSRPFLKGHDRMTRSVHGVANLPVGAKFIM